MARAGGQRAQLTGRQSPGGRAQNTLQLKPPRAQAVHRLAVRVQQEQGRIGHAGQGHLREMRQRENVRIPVGRETVQQFYRRVTAGGNVVNAAVHAIGEPPICVQEIQLIAADRNVNRVLDLRDLDAEKDVGRILESVHLLLRGGVLPAVVDPDRPRGRVQHIQFVAVQRHGHDAPPVGAWRGQRERARRLPGRAIQ